MRLQPYPATDVVDKVKTLLMEINQSRQPNTLQARQLAELLPALLSRLATAEKKVGRLEYLRDTIARPEGEDLTGEEALLCSIAVHLDQIASD